MKKSIFDKVIKILRQKFSVQIWSKKFTAFEVLVATILSQATQRQNNIRAFKNLRKKFRIIPNVLARANLDELIKCIRPAGLHRIKALRIKKISKILTEKNENSLEEILNKSCSEAREELLNLPGVGTKTADVVLSFVAQCNVFPIDTHIRRIIKRWGLVKENAVYEEIRAVLESLVKPKERLKVHLILIEFGREVCNSRRPKCEVCPISRYCLSRNA
ncbi:MAG: endonuclease III [Patescibacteria group bacterium]|nr:endonuclease III [Patescibacteria group bacterium]